MSNETGKYCECGCGGEVNPGNRFILGHNSRTDNPFSGKHHSDKTKKMISEANINPSEAMRKKMSDAHIGIRLSEEHKRNISKSGIGRKVSEETRKRMSIAQTGKKMPPRTDEARQHMSAGMQGIPYEEWTGFISNGEYCEKFDQACRERIRAKYDYRCLICDKHQDENITKTGRQIALSVHHVDYSKMQGCDGEKWKLVPLCMICHAKTNCGDRGYWEEYIMELCEQRGI